MLGLTSFLDGYKAFIQGAAYDELYKWQIARSVQDNWDLNTPELAGMIDRSFRHKHQNLWAGLNFPPKRMLMEWAANDPEDCRKALQHLIHGQADLADRMRAFDRLIQAHLRAARPVEDISSYQDVRAMSVWLGMVLPEQHYLYKASMVKAFCERTGRPPLAKPGDKYTVIDAYYKLCEELRTILEERPDIVQAHQALRNASCHSDPAHHLLVQDFMYFVAERMKGTAKERPVHYWLYAPGPGAEYWDEFRSQGIMALGWDDLGAFSEYGSVAEVAEELRKLDGSTGSKKNDANAVYDLANTMAVGDIIIAKKGRGEYLGYGIVEGELNYAETRSFYRNCRPVNWKKTGTWPELEGPIVLKTLTDISKYPDYVSRLRTLIGIDEPSGSPIGLIMVNITWNSRDWKAPSQDKSNHGYVKEGNTPMESWNFDFDNPRNPPGKALGFVQHTAPPRLEGDNNLVIFHSAGKVVGFYGKGQLLKDKLRSTDGNEYNIIGDRALAMVLPNKLEDIKAKGYLEDKQRMGMNGFIYLKEPATALRMIDEALWLNPSESEKLNALRAWVAGSTSTATGQMKTKTMEHPLNTILYGPPGTGKTYHAITHAVAIIDGEDVEVVQSRKREQVRKRYQELFDTRLVRTVTFHQSFSYEDFIEGIKPQTHVGKDQVRQVTYDVENGIFKEMCIAARSSEHGGSAPIIDEATLARAEFYKVSLGQYNNPADDEIYTYCMTNGVIAIGYGGVLDVSKATNELEIRRILKEAGVKENEEYSYTAYALRALHLDLKEGDIVLVSAGNTMVRAIGRVSGPYFVDVNAKIPYKEFRKVEWIKQDVEIPVEEIFPKNFSMGTIYNLDRNLVKLDYFRQRSRQEATATKRYVLIIDEINRGNVASIFGELITLIEDDKREKGDEPARAKLPYSKDDFSVPSNLYLIGTMNTADRSVEALDTALRRRFSFVEMPSKPKLIEPKAVEDIDLLALLNAINERVEQLIDKDHHIGHSYFMGLKNAADLKRVFATKVIPLLEEYFHGDAKKMGAVLGEAFVESRKKTIAFAKGFDMDEYEVKELYTVKDPRAFTDVEPFKAIYTSA
jgi:predicted Mrr-cat superfamily restriction endonuclease